MSRPASVSSTQSKQRPTSTNDVDLNISRMSNISQNSQNSTITLGGVEYNVGSRIGNSGLFVIGDPRGYDKNSNRASTPSVAGSHAPIVKDVTYPYVNKGYEFENWAWPSIRFGCLIVVFAIMIGLLAAVIGLSIRQSEKCSTQFLWWRGSVIYNIPVRLFHDFDKDNYNTGDLRGIQQKVEYFNYLGAEVVSLSEFLPSVPPGWDLPMSFTDVDSRVGTIAQFQDLVQEMHRQKKRVMVELSLAHTSRQHAWFKDSRQQSTSSLSASKYREFYMWENEPSTSSEFKQGSWKFDQLRQQYYFHMNNTELPLLNWTNPFVVREVHGVLEYWLREGVDGFLIRDIDKLFVKNPNTVLSILDDWRSVLDNYGSKAGDDHKVLMVEDKYLRYIEDRHRPLLSSMLKDVDLIETPLTMPSANVTFDLQGQVEKGLQWPDTETGQWVSWRLVNLTQIDLTYRPALQLFTGMLPGTLSIMAGEEIGLFFWEWKKKDMNPLLWSSTSMTPYNPDIPGQNSMIPEYRDLFRDNNREHSLRQNGFETNGKHNIDFLHIDESTIFFERRFGRKDRFYYAANFGPKPVEMNWLMFTPSGTIVTDSQGRQGRIRLQNFALQVGQATIFKTAQ